MIRVTPQPEPSSFDGKVRKPGFYALLEQIGSPAAPKRRGPKRRIYPCLAAIPSSKLKPTWTECLPELRGAYDEICAYLGLRIQPHTGGATVDHFLPKSKYRRHAYEWSNFRLAARPVNTKKGEHQVLDPFHVDPAHFEFQFSNGRLVASLKFPKDVQDATATAIAVLDLNAPTYMATRLQGVDDFLHKRIDRSVLERDYPIVAHHLARGGDL